MNYVKDQHWNLRFLSVAIVLMGLLVLSLSFSAAQVQSQDSYVIVHALNPEGIEIASIEAMDPYCVEIYDGDALIGYGAHDNETYNKPIAISPGAHTIKAKFNGMSLERDVYLEPGETETLVFVFPRTTFNLLENIGNCDIESSVSGGWSGPSSEIEDTKICSNNPGWKTETYFWDPCYYRSGVYDLKAGLSFQISENDISWSNYVYADIDERTYSECPSPHQGHSTPYWHTVASATTSEDIELNTFSPNFDKWYLQYTSFCEGVSLRIDGIEYLGIQGDNILETISANQNSFLEVTWGERLSVTGYNAYHHSYDGRLHMWNEFEESGGGTLRILMSSVPYDLTGTGIGGEPVASLTYSPENPLVTTEITFDASSSYDPDGEIVSYNWDFGDGNSAEGKVVTHAYAEASEYAVTLTVTDNDGLTDSTELSLEVKPIPVLLVHGWRGSPDDMLDLENWLQDPDHGAYPDEYVERFGYEAVYHSIVDSAFYLQCYVPLFKRRLGLGEGDRIDIVAHSMGGLVSRWYIEKLGGDEHVRKLIMLGTPNKGSWLANLAILRWWDIAVRDLRPFAQIYHDLNDGFSQPQTEYRVIAGTGDHSPFYLNIIPGVPGVPDILKNDFIVTVESARGPGFSLIEASGDGHSQSVVNVNPLISTHLLGNESTFQKVLDILSSEPSQQTSMSVQGQVISSSSPYTPTVSPHNAMISGILYPGETKSHTTPVDSTSGSASFTVFWLNDGTQGNFDLTLQKPDVTVIDPVVAETDPNITFVGDASLGLFDLVTEYYIVQSPDPGTWTMKITPVNVPSSGKQYFITVFLGSNVALNLSTDKYFYDLNDQISITATLLDDTTPLTGASVTAEVQRPDEAVDNIALYDDGSHGDLQADDGVYCNTYTSTAMGGQYDIKVSVSGTTAGGTDFVREATTGVVLDSAIPIANAGPDQIVAVGKDVVFDGSGSSDDDGIAVHLWDIDTLADSDSDGIADNDVDLVGVNPTLIGGYAVTGTHTVQLAVDDAAGNGPTTDTMTVTVQECIFGDFNCDCVVDVKDISLVASRWRTSCDNPDPDNNSNTPNYETRYDLDGDCDVDIVDIMLVVVHWGETCGG